MRTEIHDRKEFDAHLVDATAKMGKLMSKEGQDSTLVSVLRQLETIAQWTANDALLTPEQVKDINMGLLALREMDDFPVEQDLVVALSNYIKLGKLTRR